VVTLGVMNSLALLEVVLQLVQLVLQLFRLVLYPVDVHHSLERVLLFAFCSIDRCVNPIPQIYYLLDLRGLNILHPLAEVKSLILQVFGEVQHVVG